MQDLVSATDPAGHSYLVDGFHHVTQHNDPAGKSTLYRYDANGELTKVTDPRSKGTIYTRNGFGDVVSLVSPDTGTTTFTYDSAGNVLMRKDAKGQTLTYHYDALNRLTDVSSSVSGESVTTFSYDGTLNGKSRLTGINEPSGNAVFDYNTEGLLSSAVWAPGNANSSNPSSYQTRYSYDAAGRLRRGRSAKRPHLPVWTDRQLRPGCRWPSHRDNGNDCGRDNYPVGQRYSIQTVRPDAASGVRQWRGGESKS